MRCSTLSSGSSSVNLPWASVLVLDVSCIPPLSESSVTSSPSAGFPVVAFVTVPVSWAAKSAVERNRQQVNVQKRATNRWTIKQLSPFFTTAGLRVLWKPKVRIAYQHRRYSDLCHVTASEANFQQI